MRHKAVVFVAAFGRAVSASHAITSWGADKVSCDVRDLIDLEIILLYCCTALFAGRYFSLTFVCNDCEVTRI